MPLCYLLYIFERSLRPKKATKPRLVLDLCYRYRTEISGFMQSSIARFNCMVLYGIDIYCMFENVVKGSYGFVIAV